MGQEMLEKLPAWLVRSIVYVANNWDWLGRKLNALAINGSVNVCRPRPHPWSTAHDYVSWTSLTDRRWSARHLPASRVPDPPISLELLKELFRRPQGQPRLCTKSTCLFPAFAQYLTDGFIRTEMPKTDDTPEERRRKRRRNTSNHQIDLCPLYGRTPEQTDALRVKNETLGSRGRLKSQFVEDEEYAPFLFHEDLTKKQEFAILDEPLGLDNFPNPELRKRIFAFGGDRTNATPHVAMINTLFLREHNRLAGEIEKNNLTWDDERIFQTARNITIVLFIKIVVEEYINHISPAPFRFRADPSVAWEAPWNQPNWITTEFSLLYRWHSLIPDTLTWNGKPYPVGSTLMDNRPLIDAGLARAFADMSAQRAGRLGTFNTPEALLNLEVSAIEQSRFCDLAPYGDYRNYVSLSRPKEFSDISQNPDVVRILTDLYQKPGKVEFYVGLFAEDTVKNSPLPRLLLIMVGVDAFSQALTNPLLSKNVYNADTFTELGMETINDTSSLRDVLHRNSPRSVGDARISMTWEGWKYQW